MVQPQGLRVRRYERRGLLWAESSLERVRKCGRVPNGAGGVAVRLRGQVAGFAGLCSCGSVWVDPVCNAKIMARRAVEIGAAVATWQAAGGSVAFVTMTMRHYAGQGLDGLWTALAAAWKDVTGGSPWVRARQRYGVAGWLKVVEVTIGPNGWHVHVHALLFLDGKATSSTVAGLHGAMFARWSKSLVRQGLAAPLMLGQDARLLTGPADQALADYFTKATDRPGRAIGLEFTQTQTKNARKVHKTRPVWSLLDLVEVGDADALDQWHEWEQGSKGRRQIAWSKGLRDRLGLLAEQSDEDIAAQELGSSADDLVLIDVEGWATLVRTPARLAVLLQVTEQGGLGALRSALDSWSVSYSVLGA